MPGHDIYLVGSVPMANSEEVFSRVSAALGSRLKRIPDGETGRRLDWITWLEPVFQASAAMEKSSEAFQLHAMARTYPRYKLKPGKTIADFKIDNLFYAEIAQDSYGVFKSLRDSGRIPAGTRFQVDLAPAHSVLWVFIAHDLQASFDPIYNVALGGEIDKIAAAIPHHDLAIQLDVASAIFARLERQDVGDYGRTKEEMKVKFTDILAKLANRVPDDIELLFHFCYGDNNHRHVVEPTDMADMVDMATRLTAAIDRPINLVHMPVPRNRTDEKYFAPLSRLRLRPETELALGLVHYTDGLEGTLRRMATASKFVQNYAIGTECGFGRRKPETISELLRIHARAAEAD